MSEKIIYIHDGDLLSRKLAVVEGGTFDGWLMRDEAGLLEPFKDISCFVFQRESALLGELERVKGLLVKAADYYKRGLECEGGCDHSVGICSCGDRYDYEEIKEALAPKDKP